MNLSKITRALENFSYGIYIATAKDNSSSESIVATWVMQVSFEPPLIALSAERDSRFRQLLESSGSFTVHVVPVERIEIARSVLRNGQLSIDEALQGAHLTGARGESPGMASTVECRVVGTHEAGDHILYIGKVTDAHIGLDGEPLTLRMTGWKYRGKNAQQRSE